MYIKEFLLKKLSKYFKNSKTMSNSNLADEKDYSVYYFISNIIAFIIIYSLFVAVVVHLIINIDVSIFFAVILSVFFLYPIAYFEEHYLSIFVGYLVEKIIKLINRS
ncbi:MAG: hypothetical protein IJ736_13645 [Firmicutes bacterium]|nr:hypothetical protein [Bacillota bacterium]